MVITASGSMNISFFSGAGQEAGVEAKASCRVVGLSVHRVWNVVMKVEGTTHVLGMKLGSLLIITSDPIIAYYQPDRNGQDDSNCQGLSIREER